MTRVAEYIRERASEGTLQFVVISLKDNFYDKVCVRMFFWGGVGVGRWAVGYLPCRH